jgi:Flp pilus assembly pilin Flp
MNALEAAFDAIGNVVSDDAGVGLAEYALLASTLGATMIAGVLIVENNAAAVLSGTASGWQNMAMTPP